MSDHDQSISDRLAAVGLSHARDRLTDTDCRHVVTRADTGDVLGRYRADEVARLLPAWEREAEANWCMVRS